MSEFELGLLIGASSMLSLCLAVVIIVIGAWNDL